MPSTVLPRIYRFRSPKTSVTSRHTRDVRVKVCSSSSSDLVATDKFHDGTTGRQPSVESNSTAKRDDFPAGIPPEDIERPSGGAPTMGGNDALVNATTGQNPTVGHEGAANAILSQSPIADHEGAPLNAPSDDNTTLPRVTHSKMRRSDSRTSLRSPRRPQQWMRVVSLSWRPPSSRAASELPVMRNRAGSATAAHAAWGRAPRS